MIDTWTWKLSQRTIQGFEMLTGAGITFFFYSVTSEEDLCQLNLILGNCSKERINVIHWSHLFRCLVWCPWSMSTTWRPAGHRLPEHPKTVPTLCLEWKQILQHYLNIFMWTPLCFSSQVMMMTEVLHMERLFISHCHPHVLLVLDRMCNTTPSTGL